MYTYDFCIVFFSQDICPPYCIEDRHTYLLLVWTLIKEFFFWILLLFWCLKLCTNMLKRKNNLCKKKITFQQEFKFKVFTLIMIIYYHAVSSAFFLTGSLSSYWCRIPENISAYSHMTSSVVYLLPLLQ